MQKIRIPSLPAVLMIAALVAAGTIIRHRSAGGGQVVSHGDATRMSEPSRPAGADMRSVSPAGAVAGAIPRGDQDEAAALNRGEEPVHAFRAWAAAFAGRSTEGDARRVEEGVRLAKAHRAALLECIRRDSRRALELAVPMALRQALPEQVAAHLETRVSGKGSIALLAITPAPGQQGMPAYRRSVTLGATAYRAHVHGRRDVFATVDNTTVTGIVIDGEMAVGESPLRVLEDGEQAGGRVVSAGSLEGGAVSLSGASAPRPTGLVAEVAGEWVAFDSREELAGYEALLTGKEVLMGDNLPGSTGSSVRPPRAWTTGTKKVLVIRVDFSDKPGTPVYETTDANGQTVPVAVTDEVAADVFNRAKGVANYYRDNSFGKVSIVVSPAVGGDSPDVTDVLRMPQTAVAYATSGMGENLHYDARTAAAAAGHDLAAYDRIVVVFSKLNKIPGSLITYGGLGEVGGRNLWINGAWWMYTLTHELGHTFGMLHSNMWQFGDGNPVSPTGNSLEYGDPFCLMGGGLDFENHINHRMKSLMWWLPDDTGVQVVSQPGTYRVYRFDHPDADLGRPRSLRITRDAARDYWVGYRRATAWPTMRGGAYVLWGYNNSTHSDLIDTAPATATVMDAGLAVGSTFKDPAGGVTMRVLAQGGTGAEEYLDIEVGLSGVVRWGQASYQVGEVAGSVTLTAHRDRISSGVVSVGYTTQGGSATEGVDYTAGNGVITWADGDMAPKTVTIPILADNLAEGVESFTVTLSNPVGAELGPPDVATVTIAPAGARDGTFYTGAMNRAASKVLALPDGSSLVCGIFSDVMPPGSAYVPRGGIVRLLDDGSIDPVYASAGGATGGTDPVIETMARQADGRIIVGGRFTAMNGVPRVNLARLNPDGSVDSGFAPGIGPSDTVHASLVQPDGRILIGGRFTSYGGVARKHLARLHPDGSLDTSFTGPDLIGGSLTPVTSLALQPDGRVLVGGLFYLSATSPVRSGICRLLPSGAVDPSFSGLVQGAISNAFYPNSLAKVSAMILLSDGKIVVGGNFDTFNGQARGRMARLNPDGSLDGTFSPSFNSTVNSLLALPGGDIMAAGYFATCNGSSAPRLAQLAPDGQLRGTFTALAGPTNYVSDLAMQADGKVIFTGERSSYQGSSIYTVDLRTTWRTFPEIPGLPSRAEFAAGAVIGREGGKAVLTVNRAGGSRGAFAVSYATVPGTATAEDFTAASGLLEWADGETAPKTIEVLVTSDAVNESGEFLAVHLGQPGFGGGVPGGVTRAVVGLQDPAPQGPVFATWMSERLAGAGGLPPDAAGPGADPDGDGIANLLEYAFGLDPLAGSSDPVGITRDGSGIALVYKRPADRSDLVYWVEQSGDLVTWSGTGVVEERLAGGPVESWRARVDGTGRGRVFLRLRVRMVAP